VVQGACFDAVLRVRISSSRPTTCDSMPRHLFPNLRLKGSKYRIEGAQPTQLRHLADPAARRAVWLVLQVICYIPFGLRLALRLAETPQDVSSDAEVMLAGHG
jgi:hypothetical protein